jgi:membrane-associated protease RseP (regulator of RpoE activity)
MRLFGRLGLLGLGFYAGLLAAAALVKRVLPSRGGAESDEVALTAIMGGLELKSRAQAFRGGTLLAWFGGIAVDLREASLAPNAELTVGALFGGVDVKLPPGWRVVSTARALAGGVSDDVPEPDDPAAPTLTIQSTAAFGGVSIRVVAADQGLR